LLQPAPIFLKPVFKERIWGGYTLRERFHYDIPSEKTGECWAISAHPNGQSTVADGPYAGWKLGELWNHHRELFGHHPSESFPLLVKILDTNDDLSVQVHPDDSYANRWERGENGKTECWYVIDCTDDAEMVYGHTAQTREEFEERLQKGEWDRLLHRVKVKPGDFFYVPSGTVHALGAGMLVLETQQNSDTTYRLYDYDRVDTAGNKRELHIERALGVIRYPHRDAVCCPQVSKVPGGSVTTFITCDYFTVQKWDVNGNVDLWQPHAFMNVSVIDGNGELVSDSGARSVKKGDHFILPYGIGRVRLTGELTLIVSFP
jgi:mannose-6-phosphate isomerase